MAYRLLSDKELKKKYRPIFWKTPDKYYATAVLKEEGFSRHLCASCKIPFWSIDPNRKVCGDPACSPGESFTFLGKSPAKEALSYVEVWKKFSAMFKKLGYTPIPRYPIVARWNATMDFTNASIAAFQPYVVSGEIEPPANPLVIPQPCFRTPDIDAVGLSGAHMTVFTMIGQHWFTTPEQWDQNKVFRDIHAWFTKGLGLPNTELIFHEDAWAGGGNLGCCMEIFSRGCELANQVYMLYEQTPTGVQDLKIKVLDMGMGQERNAWFSQGTNTIYEATFPTVIKNLLKRTGLKVDQDIIRKFVPYAGRLNLDEVEDVEKAWKAVAARVGVDVKTLQANVLPLAALYSVAEHSRTLLVMLADGALPSNVGGGYNLRVILRRALAFIDQYKWDVSLSALCREHAKDLKPLFPELMESLTDIDAILEVEKVKYESTKQKSQAIVRKLIQQKITEAQLLQLYDSNGIPPEIIREEARKMGKTVKVPDNFYVKVTELHAKQEQEHATERTEKMDLAGIPETEALYFSDYLQTDFTATVLKVEGSLVVLDKTQFYPTSGGQIHDTGMMGPEAVIDVFKQGNHIVHVLKNPPQFKVGTIVQCCIDKDRRRQLAQHHTATHILNAATRRILGSHINQAGAKKGVDKAHLDVTHFQAITPEELKRIEEEANKIIREQMPVRSAFYGRGEAERKFSTRIYQGGAVPGKRLRIVEIPEVDVEACGGTHLKNTAEAQEIKILKATKVQDGIVRIFFTAGKAARQEDARESQMLQETAKILGVPPTEVPARAQELFETWKNARKAAKKGQPLSPAELLLKAHVSEKLTSEELLKKTALIFQTQPEHVPKTAKRFLEELEQLTAGREKA